MIELRERPDGTLTRFYGGDTLNTAVYLARLGAAADYVTALGDDPWSSEMLAHWRAEGVGCGLVQRLPGRLPGLYIIQTDAQGERRFLYWRDSAAARLLFDTLPADALAPFGLVYLSGITLSIYDPPSRDKLFAMLAAIRAAGGRVAFDTNYRPRGWPDPAVARALYQRLFAMADIILASSEDLRLLFGATGWPATDAELVLKTDDQCSHITHAGQTTMVRAAPVAQVVDTTAAGDSFAAAYLAARLRGYDPARAAAAGHRLAGAVVGHAGAIIPAAAMPTPVWEDAP